MLLQHEVMGPRARWERYTANLLYVIAAGKKIDENRTRHFGDLLDEVYANPFEKREKQPETAAEIKERILGDIDMLLAQMTEEENGSAEPGREDHAG